MNISASIVIYNEKQEVLKRAIEDFLAIELEKELVIVDNSQDNSMKELCESYKNVKYVFSEKNIGFGAGHNLAFSHLSKNTNLHLIINPDIYFDSNEMFDFLSWLNQERNVSLAIPKVLNPDGSVQNVIRNIPTPISLLKRKFHINYDELVVNDNQITQIPFAHGCFMAFKTDVFNKICGFDERFFMYMEDIDIFLRAKKYGKTVMNSNYKIYHEYRKGSSKSLRLFFWHIASVAKFFMKKYD